MHASWLMLAVSGEIPARILQTRATKFIREGERRVTEIDFTNPQFPQIKPSGALPEDADSHGFESLRAELNIIGDHELFVRELKKAFTMAEFDSPLLLLGETGAGKEVFARLIHRASKRGTKPFITVNCAAFSETLIESQLFGHRRGGIHRSGQRPQGLFRGGGRRHTLLG
jgi:transcriptional regulator with PAS, ATPase and Fis domain